MLCASGRGGLTAKMKSAARAGVARGAGLSAGECEVFSTRSLPPRPPGVVTRFRTPRGAGVRPEPLVRVAGVAGLADHPRVCVTRFREGVVAELIAGRAEPCRSNLRVRVVDTLSQFSPASLPRILGRFRESPP